MKKEKETKLCPVCNDRPGRVYGNLARPCEKCEEDILMHQTEDEERSESDVEYEDYVVVCQTDTIEYKIYLVATSLLDAVQKARIPEGAVITKAYIHE